MFVAILTGVLYHMALPIQMLGSIICLANYYLPSAFIDVNMKDRCLNIVLQSISWLSAKSFSSYNP